MLKQYHERHANDTKTVAIIVPVVDSDIDVSDSDVEETKIKDTEYPMKLHNSDVLANLDQKLSHLPPSEYDQLKNLLFDFQNLFSDVPSQTDLIYHDVDVGNSTPIKQHPYRANPIKLEQIRNEVQYMLRNGIIEPSNSNWSSPCLLVPKPDKSVRFCTDFRKVNNVTKTDSFPIPRIDDCIDSIGCAKFITKLDLLKGYWQVPLTDRAKEVSAFVTPDALYHYLVMPYGMKNSQATFQRLVNKLISGIEGCKAYVDDIVIFSDSWEKHIEQLCVLFKVLSEAKLTINLVKSDFSKATLVYLGHVVGQGHVAPVNAKIDAIVKFPVPVNKRELMRFLGMAGYYRKFCQNFSDIAAPLTNLLCKNVKFIWSNKCQKSFDFLKYILQNAPVLCAPNFECQFILAVDSSDIGAGSVLMQEDDSGLEHPICYFSRKYNKHQCNYSTVEKEALALLLSLQHFHVYLETTVHPILVFTDHNPLTFLHKIKNQNQRLLRWSLILQEYNLEIKHIRGKDNVVADALSRVK